MAELIVTVSAEGELVIRSEGLSRAQWEQASAELRAILGESTRQAVEAEQHVHHMVLLQRCGVWKELRSLTKELRSLAVDASFLGRSD